MDCMWIWIFEWIAYGYGYGYDMDMDVDTDLDMVRRCSKILYWWAYPCLEVDDALFYIQNDTGNDKTWE